MPEEKYSVENGRYDLDNKGVLMYIPRPHCRKGGNLFRNAMDQQLSVDANSSHDLSPKKTSQLSLSAKHKKVLRVNYPSSHNSLSRLLIFIFRSIFLTTAFVNSLSRERASPPLVRTEHDHCKCLVGLFEKIMDNLSEPDSWLGSIRIYGEKHAQVRRPHLLSVSFQSFQNGKMGLEIFCEVSHCER
ncbi:unnamed protein product [Nippostrongylus brasiliensis]|uniref:GLOBIN domain-containing protein n=1 Tax=Nippostrongylus brasiliensis TaxID=27835 RepID=A0A0N4XCJ2_NIPBR|nr:unnamed protein product [Nippostrongylus brasiliensis]